MCAYVTTKLISAIKHFNPTRYNIHLRSLARSLAMNSQQDVIDKHFDEMENAIREYSNVTAKTAVTIIPGESIRSLDTITMYVQDDSPIISCSANLPLWRTILDNKYPHGYSLDLFVLAGGTGFRYKITVNIGPLNTSRGDNNDSDSDTDTRAGKSSTNVTSDGMYTNKVWVFLAILAYVFAYMYVRPEILSDVPTQYNAWMDFVGQMWNKTNSS